MFQCTRARRHSALLALCVPVFLVSSCSDSDDTKLQGPTGGTTGNGVSGSSGSPGSGGSSGSSAGSNGVSGNGGAAAGNGGSGGAVVVADTSRPTVVSNHPDENATGESAGVAISVRFNEAMLSTTLTDTSFNLKRGTVVVAGAVTYFNREATFLPTDPLALGTSYTATVTTAVQDLAGNALATAKSWSFQTDNTAPLGPRAVLLGAAGKFAILAKTAVANVPTSVISGDLGLSPAAASYITGFALTRAGTMWTEPQVVGEIYAADNDPPTPADMTTAISNMEAAYSDAAGRGNPDHSNLFTGEIGGETLAPGLYTWNNTVTIPADVTIAGAPNDVWIFQIANDLTMDAGKSVLLSGGARAKNIFWQVAGTVNLGTTAHFEGIILSQTAIALGAGASVNGRLLAQTAVNVASSTVTEPAR
ncbi:MAG: ice-binding family protein [Deltaproteobacteria bacterium]